jgi:hypothetical protein
LEQKKINIPYYCPVCNTKNNKWHSIYYQTDGQILLPVKGVFLSTCMVCDKVKTMELKMNEVSNKISGLIKI